MNYITKNIEISGETYTIKVPKDEIFKEAYYEEIQASKIIYLNLNDKLKEKISLSELATLINFQGEYIENQQKTNSNFTEMDESNIKFLYERLESVGPNLSKEEILEIFDVELFYMKLIKVIE
ncbi:hypothetical protein ACWGOQ_0010880 [Aquimarina sp. M1]